MDSGIGKNKDIDGSFTYTRYVCAICGYTYDAVREVMQGRADELVEFDKLPDDWVCVQCHRDKSHFAKVN